MAGVGSRQRTAQGRAAELVSGRSEGISNRAKQRLGRIFTLQNGLPNPVIRSWPITRGERLAISKRLKSF